MVSDHAYNPKLKWTFDRPTILPQKITNLQKQMSFPLSGTLCYNILLPETNSKLTWK